MSTRSLSPRASRPLPRTRGHRLLGATISVGLALVPSTAALAGDGGEDWKDEAQALVGTFFANALAIQDESAAYVDARLDRAAAINELFLVLGDPERLLEAANDVHLSTFGSPFVPEASGFVDVGEDGDALVGSLTGETADIHGLTLWPFDVVEGAFELPDELDPGDLLASDPDLALATSVYTATFGEGLEHVGYAIDGTAGGATWRVFVPLLVPENVGDVPAAVVADLLAGALNGDGEGGSSWADDLPPYQGPTSQGIDLIALAFQLQAAGFPCDPFALVDCLIEVLNELAAKSAATRSSYEQRINELLANWANGQTADLWAWLAGGAATGALTGAAIGAPAAGIGSIPGAVVGGAVGAIGGLATGGFAWLVGTGVSAEDIAAQVDQLRGEMNAELCQHVRDAAQKAKECFATYCPDLAELAAQEIDAAVAASGC